jgi:hypothetical protein
MTKWIAMAALMASGCSVLIDSNRIRRSGATPGPTIPEWPMEERRGWSADKLRGCRRPAGTVLGFSHLRYVSATGEERLPEDLAAYTIQAYLREGDGFRVIDGIGTADGTFRIDGVPDGETYYLKLVNPAGTASFNVTALRCVELDRYLGGRSDAVTVSLSQPLELHLDNMQPWGNQDWLIAEVFNTSTENWAFEDVLAPPLARGATSIDGTYDWGCPYNCYSYRVGRRPALIDTSRGDYLQLAHARLAEQLDSEGRLQHAISTIDAVDVAEITMPVGGTTVVNATFAPIQLSQMVRFVQPRTVRRCVLRRPDHVPRDHAGDLCEPGYRSRHQRRSTLSSARTSSTGSALDPHSIDVSYE